MLDKSKPELHYQSTPPSITRGQFRLLLLLTLIQVVMTAQSNYAPGFTAWIKSAWAEHQRAAAHRAAVKKNLADLQQCLAYSEPGDKVVWEEDPAGAAKLLDAGGYQAIAPYDRNQSTLSSAVPPMARADLPHFIPESVYEDLGLSPGNESAVVFLHGRHAPGQPDRLVVVCIHGMFQSTESGGGHQPDESFDGFFYKWQNFVATSLDTHSDDGTPTPDAAGHTSLALQPSQGGTEMPAHWSPATQPGNPGTLTVQYKQQLRVYAGQADPADASHFTINYDLDNQPGVIDGWLKPDGSVVLQPRAGKVVNALWYPYAK